MTAIPKTSGFPEILVPPPPDKRSHNSGFDITSSVYLGSGLVPTPEQWHPTILNKIHLNKPQKSSFLLFPDKGYSSLTLYNGEGMREGEF